MFFLIIGLFVIAALTYFKFPVFKNVTTTDRFGSTRTEKQLNKPNVIIVAGMVIGLFFLVIINPIRIERIDAGYRGIKVSNIGDEKGVGKTEYVTGWVFYNSWISRIYEFPTFQQHIEYDEQQVITKGGFSATIKPSFNYSLNSGSIADMFSNLRLQTKDIEQGWLKNAIISSVNDVSNKFPIDSVFNHREQFEAAILKETNERVKKWFTVSQLRTNIVPPQAIQQAIINKTAAIQNAQVAENQKMVAIAEGQAAIAKARADSSVVVINAAAQAKANSLLQQSLSDNLIKKMWIEKWSGSLPNVVTGSNGTIMYNLKD